MYKLASNSSPENKFPGKCWFRYFFHRKITPKPNRLNNFNKFTFD